MEPGYKELTVGDLEALIAGLTEDTEADPFLIKRTDRRWVFRGPADLYCQEPDGTEVKVHASVRDVCMTGLGLVVRNRLPVDTVVRIVLALEDGYYAAKVRIVHCTQTVGGFKIGCDFVFDSAPAIPDPADDASDASG